MKTPNKEEVIAGLGAIASSEWMLKHADYYQLICKEALALLEAQEKELEELRLCRHKCKIDCLLKSYNELDEKYKVLLKAQTPRVLARREYRSWNKDAWYEDMESGTLVAVDRSAVRAYVEYMARDGYEMKRLWTARPTDEQREETPWAES